jgi:hypothetical protein
MPEEKGQSEVYDTSEIMYTALARDILYQGKMRKATNERYAVGCDKKAMNGLAAIINQVVDSNVDLVSIAGGQSVNMLAINVDKNGDLPAEVMKYYLNRVGYMPALVADGKDKADVVYKIVEGPFDEKIVASKFIKEQGHTRFIMDLAAAGKLPPDRLEKGETEVRHTGWGIPTIEAKSAIRY